MKKQSIAIIGVIAFVLAVAVGYALFSDQLTVTGTAKASGKFDYDLSVGEITEVGTVKGDGATAAVVTELSNDNDKLTITINKLAYPGAKVTIPVTVTNTGTITGKLDKINEAGLIVDDEMIKVTYTGPAASDTPLAAGEKHDMLVEVEWPEDYSFEGSNKVVEGTDNEVASEVEFTVTLDYIQVNQ